MEARTAVAYSMTSLKERIRQLDDCIEEIERFRNSWGDAVRVLMLERVRLEISVASCTTNTRLLIAARLRGRHGGFVPQAWQSEHPHEDVRAIRQYLA